MVSQKRYRESIEGLTAQMEELSSRQKRMKDGQTQIRHKVKAIEAECEELRRETALIIQQTANTQNRLALMFQILKAREKKDFTKAAQLSQTLRELILGENA